MTETDRATEQPLVALYHTIFLVHYIIDFWCIEIYGPFTDDADWMEFNL